MELFRPPTTDMKELKERHEKDQVFGLMLALNGSFKEWFINILRFDKFPSLNEFCMLIQKEEGSKGLFQEPTRLSYVSRRSAFQPTERRNYNLKTIASAWEILKRSVGCLYLNCDQESSWTIQLGTIHHLEEITWWGSQTWMLFKDYFQVNRAL